MLMSRRRLPVASMSCLAAENNVPGLLFRHMDTPPPPPPIKLSPQTKSVGGLFYLTLFHKVYRESLKNNVPVLTGHVVIRRIYNYKTTTANRG